MLRFSPLLVLFLATCGVAFPPYQSLAGLSKKDLETILPTLEHHSPESPPGPLRNTSAKLVNDAAHPWKPLEAGDIRGPCPGLNTLASHGWLPRNGIASPVQIIRAVQEGFNMGNDLAIFLAYAALLVDGNIITNRLSIGGKSPLTGPDPPSPAIVGGLDTHAVFEGDASMTRGDAFFGDNHSFNETLFEEFSAFSQRFGAGKYNLTVATELRFKRIQDSIATNPNFSFVSPRFNTAYAEPIFPLLFFVDGRVSNQQLDLTAARSFFQNSQMPEGFFRANRSIGLSDPDLNNGIFQVFTAHPVRPGRNEGVGNYVFDPTSADLSNFCQVYTDFANQTVKSLYPNPTGALRTALNTNLDFFFGAVQSFCVQVFPFGK